MDAEARERARHVRLMMFDVDGVLTDGTLYLGQSGELMKAFHVRDGQGLKLLQDGGVEVGLLSTRSSAIVERRAEELGILLLRQGASAKETVLQALLEERGLSAEQSGFMGDDLLDLRAMSGCGFAASVPEAPEEVRRAAHYVCRAGGGRGAVREVCELLLRSQGRWPDLVRSYAS